jgi:hypothetical protein
MATREDLRSLQERVRAAIATLADLKRTPQAMAGDSWVFYRRLLPAGQWDLEAHGITSPTYKKTYKMTYVVDRPDSGFAQFFFDVEWDTPAQDMSYVYEPVGDDPYSYYIRITHADYNSTPAGIMIRANVFAPQKGVISVVEI